MQKPQVLEKLPRACSPALDSTLIVLASIRFEYPGSRRAQMSIKGEKTFEEIVERLVALFKPQPEHANADGGAGAQTSSSESVERNPAPPTSSDEEVPN
jgi:hypothetical protein